MMKIIHGLLAVTLAIASADACGPPPSHGSGTQQYITGETVRVNCPGQQGQYYLQECTASGNWENKGSCKSNYAQPSSSKHTSITHDHYHVPGDPNEHGHDTPPHYHPGIHGSQPSKPKPKPKPKHEPKEHDAPTNYQPSKPKPKPATPKPMMPATILPPKPTMMLPCFPVNELPALPQQPYQPGFVIVGAPCELLLPGFGPGLFDLTCDKNGSGRWVVEETACGGYLGPRPVNQPPQQYPSNTFTG